MWTSRSECAVVNEGGGGDVDCASYCLDTADVLSKPRSEALGEAFIVESGRTAPYLLTLIKGVPPGSTGSVLIFNSSPMYGQEHTHLSGHRRGLHSFVLMPPEQKSFWTS